MAEGSKQTIKVRTESHSDIADTPPARQHQESLTSRQFGEALVKRLREIKGEVHLRHFKEEWVPTDDGLVYEMSVEAQVEAAAVPTAA